MSATIVEYRDLPPSASGWHPVDVMRAKKNNNWDWAALLVDVPFDEIKNCVCEVAFLYVHPDEYCPDGSRVARIVWVRIPGKHRNKDRAWDALQNMMTTRH
jgi:hypothetical protein